MTRSANALEKGFKSGFFGWSSREFMGHQDGVNLIAK
jgi:hypothetical protein